MKLKKKNNWVIYYWIVQSLLLSTITGLGYFPIAISIIGAIISTIFLICRNSIVLIFCLGFHLFVTLVIISAFCLFIGFFRFQPIYLPAFAVCILNILSIIKMIKDYKHVFM